MYMPLPVCKSLFYFPGHPEPKRDEVTGCWRKLHNEALHMLYSSSSIIRMIKSRRRRWAWNVARLGLEEEFMQGFGWKAKRKETTRKT
jgi:hypothetical protein